MATEGGSGSRDLKKARRPGRAERQAQGVNHLNKVWGSASVASIEDEVKRFPIRIINTGVRDTFHRASEIGLAITPEVEALLMN